MFRLLLIFIRKLLGSNRNLSPPKQITVNFSLEALSKRDQREDPFSTTSTTKTDQKPPDLPENSSEKSLYKGVFKTENRYEKGCFVTHKGSLWHCEKGHSGEFDYENFKLAQKKWGET